MYFFGVILLGVHIFLYVKMTVLCYAADLFMLFEKNLKFSRYEFFMTTTLRSVISLCIGILLLFYIVLSMPTQKIMPRGLFLPSIKKAPITEPRLVHYYSALTVPFSFETIGWINIEYHVSTNSSEAQNTLQSLASSLALRAGGNALIVDLMAHTSDAGPSPLSMEVFRAQVILVPDVNNENSDDDS